jgi:putative peptidoglycan lipid II flippase
MVRNLLSLLNARQTSILSGASVLMVTTFATKFLGLVRDRVLVHNFPTTQTDLFWAAFGLPDSMFLILVSGALTVAFIPVFTEHLNKNGETEAFKFASNILNLSLVLFCVLALFAFIFVDFINSIFVPGFQGAQKEMLNQLTRVILLGQIILVIGAFFVGIAQSFQRFLISALAPLFYNLGIILAIVFLNKPLGIMAPAFGVVIGAALHVLIQLPFIYSLGFKYYFSLNFFDKGVRDVVRLISFRNIGLAIETISERVGIALASLVGLSAVSQLTYAQHLQVVPIGLFGATLAQAALPILSNEKSRGELASFKITLLTTFHQILFLTLPAAASARETS